MNILVAFNDGYAMPTKVMLRSLILNNSEVELNIYVLYIDLNSESINSINELSDGKMVNISFIKIDIDDSIYLMGAGRISMETCIRLYAHRYLSDNLDRILWLDGDIIVLGNLEKYYNQDFEDNLYIADGDFEIKQDPNIHKKLGIPQNHDYVNAGVMLINLKKFRDIVNDKDIINYMIQNSSILDYLDQDVINGLFYKSTKVVDKKSLYNFFSLGITLKNMQYIKKHVVIIHYAMSSKPWKKNYKYLGFRIWWKYALMEKNKEELKVLKKLYYKILPSHIILIPVRIIVSILRKYTPNLLKKLRGMRVKKL